MSDVTIARPAAGLPAYIARPTGRRACGRPSWSSTTRAGMSKDLRRQADWLAEAGYLSVAPDLFAWGRPDGAACGQPWATSAPGADGRSTMSRRPAPGSPAAGRLHRQDRRHRLLHGRRFRLAPRARARIRRFQRELRRPPPKIRRTFCRRLPDRRQLRRARTSSTAASRALEGLLTA